MADSDEVVDNPDDDWVSELLAEALLGPSDLIEPDSSSPVGDESPPIIDSPPPTDDGPLLASTPSTAPTASTASTAPDETPAPAVTRRLVERPTFDATNDPGVDTMVAAERDRAIDPEPAEPHERSGLRGTVEWLVVLGSAVIVALLLRAFLFQAFYIPSESMEDTLHVNDRVLVNKVSYRLHDVNRGDVVVFSRPVSEPGEFRDLIKRVIGLPGESIEARDNTIFIDGQVLIEPYLTPGEVIGDFGPVEIPDGHVFVMGDNRDNSGDSRVFGPIETDRIIGRAFFVFWPFDRAGSI